ncbi:MAG: hypothetical protein ACRD9L_05850 [Bryobacteraceae bacterium]
MGRKRVWFVALAAASIGLAGWAGFYLREASRAWQMSRAAVAAENDLPFTAVRLDRTAHLQFQPIGSPAVYRDAVEYQGRVYLCGHAGLSAYDRDGALVAHYRAGLELPPAPLVQAAVGVAADSGAPELWIATDGAGLLAFDGRAFRQIRPAAEGARKLTSVLPLAAGRILAGSLKSGVLVYDGKRLSAFHPSLAGIAVTALAGSEEDLWIGTLRQGVLRFHAGQLDRFGTAEGMPDQQVLALAVSGNTAYAGTAMGVAEFRDGKFRRVLAPGYLAISLLPRAAALDVGTLEEGMVEVPLSAEPGRLRALTFPGKGEPPVERILQMDGRLYVLAADGLYAVSGAALTPVLGRDRAALTDRNVSALALDDAGKVWVGYFDRGLDILDASRTAHVEDQHVFCVNRIVVNRDRALTAVATANGLVLFDAAGKERQVLTRSDGLIANHVTDVLFRPGGITVATPAGLTFIDSSGVSSLYAFQGLVNNHVYALAASGNRTLAGTLGGLSVIDSGVVTVSFTTANSGLKHNWITAIARVGDDWFAGTYGAGVLRFDSAGRWQRFADLAGPVVVNENALLATGRAVYAGTLGQGLAVYGRDSGRWRFVTDGLPSGNVTALAERGGWIYVGTDNGLVRVPELELAQ